MNLAQVFFRYVLVDPISWSEETMRYATTWMVMLAAAPALLRREHMEVSLFDSVRSEALRRAVGMLVHLCVAGFCLLLMWKGFPAAIDNMRQVSPAIRVPMTLPYMAIPVGAVLILINTICMMVLPAEALASMEDGEGAP
nr:TRAP transporter small permease [Actibacterium sp. MT2.3-13A]